MKWLFFPIVLMSASAFAGNCTIAFENEVATNPVHKTLFEEVVEFKKILQNKGYSLIPMKHGGANFHAFLSNKDNNSGYTLLYYSARHPEVQYFDTDHTDDNLATSSLFKRLPHCRLR